MHRHLAAFACLALSACVTPSDMPAVPYQTALPIAANYQAVYARTLQATRICLNDGRIIFPASASNQVQGQLYPDLGYGEITVNTAGIIVTTGIEVRVEKAGGGAVVVTRAPDGDAASPRGLTAWVRYWAKGGTSCLSDKPGGWTPPTI